MPEPAHTVAGPIRFGVYEVDVHASELRKSGVRIKLEGQPFQILALLLERPGQLVTRDELKQKLWPADTFVDFEHSINTAVKRLREALGDSADAPRFIETLPKRGYRFIYPLDGTAAVAAPPAELPQPAASRRPRWVAGLLLVFLPATLVAVFALNFGGLRNRFFGPAPGEIGSIAVLPLRNISGDPQQDYVAMGITEMLITELGRVSGLRVPSHQTVLQYAGTKKPLPEIARELNVDAVLEGTVLRTGDRIRTTINFVQVQPERHLLSEKYDHELGNLLLVQDDVTQAVAGRIRAGLPPDLQRGFAKPRSVDPEVNEAYLRGRFHMSRGTDQDRARAHELFQQAVQKDPNFALAYAAMALLDAHGGAYRAAGAGPEFRGKARLMALKALELDPTMAEAHVALGWLELNDWDFAGADREFKRAIELNPNLVVARIWYAPFLGAVQRIEEADAQCEIALRLEPASPDVLTHVAWPNLYGGRPDKVIEVARKALELEPNYFAAHNLLGRAYFVKGMYAESVAELEKAIALGGEGIGSGAVLAAAYIKAGRRAEGLKLIREFEKRPRSPSGGRGLVYAYIATGETDKAIAEIEAMVERRGPYGAFLIADPLFKPLRSDPRFLELVRRVGFPPETLRRAGIPIDAPPASPPAPVPTARQRGPN